MGQQKKDNSVAILAIILILLIIVLVGLIAYKYLVKDKEVTPVNEVIQENTIKDDKPVDTPTEQNIKIFRGEQRPVAVMLNSNLEATPQVGLNSSYLVYEAIAENGSTAMMALYKDNIDKPVGSIGELRHYFIDYALENDAMVVSNGSTTTAKSDIQAFNLDVIDTENDNYSDAFEVVTSRQDYNIITNIKNVIDLANNINMETKSDEDSVLNYVEKDSDIKSNTYANIITIPYNDGYSVKYVYDTKKKTYTRYVNNQKVSDWYNGVDVTTKNIIVEYIRNADINDGSGEGRQTLYNITDAEGYYITNGKAEKITCSKSSRNGKTLYLDKDGNEININDGNTFIQIVPIGTKVDFSTFDTTSL